MIRRITTLELTLAPHEAALNYSRYIGAQQADAEKVADRPRRPVVKSKELYMYQSE